MKMNFPQTDAATNTPSAGRLFLGVDGGGTKTHAVIIDEMQNVHGEGWGGPGNPARVGVAAAIRSVEEAITDACQAAGINASMIAGARIGLAGTRPAEMRKRVRESLAHLYMGDVRVLTDARIALYGATGGAPGIVIIAGTGSICCGMNERGKHTCAGGWGPVAGDEGSGIWIARKALQHVAQATDGRGAETALTQAAYRYFGANTADELLAAINDPALTHERTAGFGREVVETAQQGDTYARAILAAAGRELAAMAASVTRRLGMQREHFRLAYVGSIFTAEELLLETLRASILRVAPYAELAPPVYPPAFAAALMALKERAQLALAG